MSEIVLKTKSKSKVKPEAYSYPNKYTKKVKPVFISQAVAEKNMLMDMILNKGLSIQEAAIRCDLDECAAYRRLFSKKPTPQQINRAIEIYDKGLSLTIACVASGVSVEHFRKAKQERSANKYNPYRW